MWDLADKSRRRRRDYNDEEPTGKHVLMNEML